MGAGVRVMPEAVRRLIARRAYAVMSERHYPIGMVEHEPGFVTGYAVAEDDRATKIDRMIATAEAAWPWV